MFVYPASIDDLKTFIDLCASLESDYKFINHPPVRVRSRLDELDNNQPNETDNTRKQSIALIIKLIATPQNPEKQFGDTEAINQLMEQYNNNSKDMPASIKNDIKDILKAEPGELLNIKHIKDKQSELESVTIDKIQFKQQFNVMSKG